MAVIVIVFKCLVNMDLKQTLHLINANNKQYFVSSVFQESGECKVLFTDGGNCWEGQISKQDVDNGSQETRMTEEKYVAMLKTSLTGISGDIKTQEFEYHLDHISSTQMELQWKAVLADVKFCLGKVKLTKSDSVCGIQHILTTCCKDLKLCHEMAATANSERSAVKEKYLNAIDELATCTKLKQEQESELLAKFVLVLNEKKKKIHQLLAQNKECLKTIADLRDQQQSLANELPHSKPLKHTINNVTKSFQVRKFSSSSEEEDSCPVIVKRSRVPAHKIRLDSPIKSDEEPDKLDTTTSDLAMTTSSDSTVDLNELIDEM